MLTFGSGAFQLEPEIAPIKLGGGSGLYLLQTLDGKFLATLDLRLLGARP